MNSDTIVGTRLSPQQDHVWRLQVAASGRIFGVHCLVNIRGVLDGESLRSALLSVVERHEILRTEFQFIPGLKVPLQVIQETVDLSFNKCDISHLSSLAQTEKIESTFYMDKPNVTKTEQREVPTFQLLKLTKKEHLLSVNLPAMCADAKSCDILARELSCFYNRGISSECITSDQLQFADVGEWEHSVLESEDSEIGRAYWRDCKLDSLLNTKLPIQREQADSRLFDPRALELAVPAELHSAIVNACRNWRVSIADFLLTCWYVFLWRLNRQSGLAVGVAVDGRNYEEIEGLVGPLTSYVPVRVGMSKHSPFKQILATVAKATKDARRWRESFSWQERLSSANVDEPYFPYIFDFYGAEREYCCGKVEFSADVIQWRTERFKLRFLGRMQKRSLQIGIEYDSACFSEEDVRSLRRPLTELVKSCLDRPDVPISAIKLVDDAMQYHSTINRNERPAKNLEEKCIHRLFQCQVQKVSDRIAIEFAAGHLTYSALETRANQLANHLRRLGVGPGVQVGILIERSPEMVVGLLGILSAGGAYLPLDTTFPKERLAFVLRNSKADIVVTSLQTGRLLPKDVHKVFLDPAYQSIASESADAPESGVRSSDLAYTIYTSGSTGRPRGVMVTHKCLVNYVTWSIRAYRLSERSAVAVNSPLAFDLTVTSLLSPLIAGGRLVLLSEQDPIGELKNAAKMGLRFDLLKLTPAHLDLLSDLVSPSEAKDFAKTIVIGGEGLYGRHVAFWIRNSPHTRLINEYGPTETVVGCCVSEVVPSQPHELPVPIGMPIKNARMYVLDDELQPLPVNVPGEIYIGGQVVSSGYCNDSRGTADRFIPDPFNPISGSRMYRSGDLGRIRADGQIEFLGRLDWQIKVRGYRIELGEIEATLNNHPNVSSSVVINCCSGDKIVQARLVAYFMPIVGADVDQETLLSFARSWLPEYMVPSDVILVREWPLTSNGKIDRSALTTMHPGIRASKSRYVAPTTNAERSICGIWAEVLGVDVIGTMDDFFELGGDSLSAVRVLGRVCEEFGVKLSLRRLFESPTVSGLAILIDAEGGLQGKVGNSSMIPRANRSEDALPLSFAQQRLWFFDQLEPGNAFYNIPSAVRLRGPLCMTALWWSVNEIIRRHESLRTTFARREGQPIQVVADELQLPLRVIDLRGLPDAEQRAQQLARREAERAFSLECGPLLRIVLLWIGDEDYLLVRITHHIISDGWSESIFLKELAVFYNGRVSGRHTTLPALPIQYVDFSVWQRQQLQGEMLAKQQAYWNEQLRDSPPILKLPIDRPRPEIQSFRGGVCSLKLPKEQTEELKKLSRQEGTTLFMTLLTALKVLLYRLSGQSDICVGTPISNRTRPETEGIIGLFLNMLPLRTHVQEDMSFRDLLRTVQKTCLDAFANKDIPFEMLVDTSDVERNLSNTPLFQVTFNMLNFESTDGNFQALESERLSIYGDLVSKFDLTLYARGGDRLEFAWVYNSELFQEETVRMLLSQLQALLTQVLCDPNQIISRIHLAFREHEGELGQSNSKIWPDRKRIHFGREDTEQLITACFAKQAKRKRNHIAVASKGTQWTYGSLDKRANTIASMILQRCGSDSGRIGLIISHDAPMVASILGVLKAGKTYVPLNPLHPFERLSKMASHARLDAVVTDSAHEEMSRMAVDAQTCIINVEDLRTNSLPVMCNGSPDELAYILYTSGSTGEPKGVMQSHRNVLRHIRNYTNALNIADTDRLTLLSSYSFDASVMDIFGALMNGARLHLFDLREIGFSQLPEQFRRAGITIYHSTPTVYRRLIYHLGDHRQLSKIRLIVLGGEQANRSDFDSYKMHFSSNCLFVNGFGPTESTLALQSIINQNMTFDENHISVGFPVEDMDVAIVGDDMEELGAGATGEIILKSSALALGYWANPDETQRVFRQDPTNPDHRQYRTGDLGRRLPDGSIEFRGRRDRQVKVDGHRVELGEVELNLRSLDGIDEAAVVVTNSSEGTRLIAYIVVKESAQLSEREYRKILARKLPRYMLPSRFVRLPTLPLNPNGKIDYALLPLQETTGQKQIHKVSAPRNNNECQLADIWCDLLELDQVGIDDDFFDLGGDSLLLIQVYDRLREVLDDQIMVIDLFRYPTIRSFFDAI